MNKPHTIDMQAVYDEKIRPLMDQVIDVCQEYDIPMVADFIVAQHPHIEDGQILVGQESVGTLLNPVGKLPWDTQRIHMDDNEQQVVGRHIHAHICLTEGAVAVPERAAQIMSAMGMIRNANQPPQEDV